MQEPYQWYVLYVRNNTEQRVVDDIKQSFASFGLDYEFDPFCPQTEVYYRGSDGKSYRKRPLFPSYVFIETNMPSKEFLREFASYIYNSTDIIRILKQGSSGEIALPVDERRRLEYLLTGKRFLEHSVGYIVGDKIDILAGPLKGFDGTITYINRHNRYADIEVEMFGGKIKARVALEIVEKR